MQKEIKVIAIPNSNQNHSYFKSTYQCQFKENSLISNKHKKKQFSGIQGKYFKMNNYKVTKGIPNITNYISSCYPPVSTGKNGTNEEYLMLKKYLPQFIAETQNYQLNNAHKNENSKFNKNKLNKDERKSYRKRNRSLSEVIYSSLIPDNKNIVRTTNRNRLVQNCLLDRLDSPLLINKLMKSSKVKDYLKIIKDHYLIEAIK